MTTIRANVNLGKAFETFKKQLDIVNNSPNDTHEQAVFNLARLKGASRVLLASVSDPDDIPTELFAGHSGGDRPESDCGNWP